MSSKNEYCCKEAEIGEKQIEAALVAVCMTKGKSFRNMPFRWCPWCGVKKNRTGVLKWFADLCNGKFGSPADLGGFY